VERSVNDKPVIYAGPFAESECVLCDQMIDVVAARFGEGGAFGEDPATPRLRRGKGSVLLF
jgi:hypothetical protein